MKKVHVELEDGLYERFEAFRRENGCTLSGFVRLAILDRLRRMAPTQEEKVLGNRIPC